MSFVTLRKLAKVTIVPLCFYTIGSVLIHARETRDLSPKRGLGKMITRNFRGRAREANMGYGVNKVRGVDVFFRIR